MRLYTQPKSPFLFFDVHVDGKRHRISTKETTVRAAEKVATAYLIKQGSGDTSRKRQQVPTLLEFSDRFFLWADNSSTIEPNTKRYYHYGMRLLSFSVLAHTPIDQIDAELIDTVAFARPVIDRRTGRETGETVPCSTSYSQQALRTLRVMLGQAHKWKVMQHQISFHIGRTPGRDGTITPAIEAIILRELSGYRTKRPWLVIITMMDCGARPSEVFEMRLENIDWAGRRIKILDGKTANAKRWVGMSERMHRELSLWCHGSEGPGWLFPSRTSGSKNGHLNSINHSFKSACERGRLDPKLVPYLSRHTFGTLAMLETGNPFMVAAAMGHGSLEAAQAYQHQVIDPLTAVINKRNAAAAKAVQASPAT
jgi:integrase